MDYNELNEEELKNLAIQQLQLIKERRKYKTPLSELIGEMRNLTEDEEISARKGLAQISEPTGLKYDEE